MKRYFGRQSTRLLAWVILLFISAPVATGAVLLGSEINGSFFIPAQSESVWEILDHDFLTDDIRQRDVEFVNSTHGLVLSQNESGSRHGMILHTNDGGDSWYQHLFNESQRFEQIEVIDSETFWVTCIGGLYHTENSGLVWNKIGIGDSDEFFYGIHFFNRTHGWTASHINLYKTTDGGQSWESDDSWTFDDDWGRMIHFINELEGWILGFLGIYHTEDGGDSWEKEVSRGGWSFSFINDNEAWVVADDWLAHMNDGATWIERPLPRTSPLPARPPYFSDILFLDNDNGWIVGDETEVAYTHNGGRDWFSQPFPHDNRVSAVDFINMTHGWAVGRDGYIYRTTRGNSLGVSLWTGISMSDIVLVASVLGIVVITISVTSVYRRRKQRSSRPQQGVELK